MMTRRVRADLMGVCLASLALGVSPGAGAASPPPTLESVLSYPFTADLVSSRDGRAVAWVRIRQGVRNIWAAQAPEWRPHRVTAYDQDDGQELTGLAFSPDGGRLVWVRGGDHDANWPAAGNLAPDPTSGPEEPKVAIWSAPTAGGTAVKVSEGDEPVVSAKGVIAFLKGHEVWKAAADGTGKPERLFFDRGHDRDLAWSSDGSALAFTSVRGDHSFIGIWRAPDRPLTWVSPTVAYDRSPVWSPDGKTLAFTRERAEGGAPQPMLKEANEPWSILLADASNGATRTVWSSPDTPEGSFPDTAGGANLTWVGSDRLVFKADLDNWPHLYVVPAAGGGARLLTPGAFMVEHVAPTQDGRIVFDANTGPAADDLERRHVFVVDPTGGAPKILTGGGGVEYFPVGLAGGRVAFMSGGPTTPLSVASLALDGTARRALTTEPEGDYPASALVAPRAVTFKASDGLLIHADLFDNPAAAAKGDKKPAVIFVHGGPPRQMLLGWHYMDYYTHGYAMNQYLAAHGYVVLSVNYRLGIGYGRAFKHPPHSGFRGGDEYLDVAAAGRFLQTLPSVDAGRIGIWGGSYGGYLTAMALSHDPDIFKVGVDLHGVHDWSATLGREIPPPPPGFEKGDRDAAMKVAFDSSPIADLSKWRSPVLLIQGDDDRNVDFHETVDLTRRLQAQRAPVEVLVLPDEIHGFLRYGSWLKSDTATLEFLDRTLKP